MAGSRNDTSAPSNRHSRKQRTKSVWGRWGTVCTGSGSFAFVLWTDWQPNKKAWRKACRQPLVRRWGPRMWPRAVKLCGELQGSSRGAKSRYVWMWSVCSYVLLEDEAGQQRGGLFHRQVIEEPVENHLRQQQLVPATSKWDREQTTQLIRINQTRCTCTRGAFFFMVAVLVGRFWDTARLKHACTVQSTVNHQYSRATLHLNSSETLYLRVCCIHLKLRSEFSGPTARLEIPRLKQ